MVTVTEKAKEALSEIRIAMGADPDEGLRLLPSPDGTFILALGTELSGDQLVGYQGYKVLLIGIEYLRILEGKTVDCQDAKDGAILFVR